MPAVSWLDDLISGIEPIFVTPHDRRHSKHPISSIHHLEQEADRLQEECRNRVRKTWMMPLEAITNLLIANKQI
jgi:uncharacterized protein Yka (UPF0111/DUF47 family)